MKSTIKLKLLPTEEQERILDGQSKICNWLYNFLIEEANRLRNQFRSTQDEKIGLTLYTEHGLRDLIPDLKEQHPFLKTIYNKHLKAAGDRISRTIRRQQTNKKLKRKKISGWPKFRSWKQDWFSLYYDEPFIGFKIEENELILSLGKDRDNKRLHLSIPIKETARLSGKKIKTLEVIKEYGKFYACFVVDEIDKPKKPIEKVIAIDPNHKNIGYGVDDLGNAIEVRNVKRLIKRHQKTIDYLKSRRDQCERKAKEVELPNGNSVYISSRRWTHFNQALQRAYRKRREQIKHLLFALGNRLFREYDLIFMGDYTPHPGTGISKGMRRSMNNESLIGKLKLILKHLALRSGKHYEEYNERNTTKTCHGCGIKNENLTVNDRSWKCLECGLDHIRDENAALNGLKKYFAGNSGKENFMSCSDLVKQPLVVSRCTWEWNFSNWMRIPKELNGCREDNRQSV